MGRIYRDDVLRIAEHELGYREKGTDKDLDSKTANAGTGNWTKYARDLWEADPHFYQGPKNGYDWCALFVDWCLYMASGMDSQRAQDALYYTGPYGAGCGMSVRYYKAAGAWHTTPEPGDQIFFGTDSNVRHTGLVEKVENGRVYTIEGNSNNMVRRRSYPLNDSSILGYGRPAYDGNRKPETMPFTDVPKNAWYYDAVRWAWENGITSGTSPTKFRPDRACTRAEAVTMLYRMSQNL
jgi:hypothetical protein